MKVFNIRISDELNDRFRNFGVRKKGDVNKIWTAAIIEYLDRHEVKQTPADAVAELKQMGVSLNPPVDPVPAVV